MFSSSAYRTAGLFALCLLVGVFFGALGGAQQQYPIPQYQVIIKGDPQFAPLVDIVTPILEAVRSWDDGSWLPLGEVKECGATIATIFGIICSRKGEGWRLTPIGRLEAHQSISLGGKGKFPAGKYFFLLGHTKGLQIQPPPGLEMGWFLVMTTPEKEILAFLLARWEGPEPEEVWSNQMLQATPRNGLPSPDFTAGCCDLTVQMLRVTARKFSTPCTAPPCPAWWDIMASATIKNIGQKDVKAPFTVQVLLNGRLIHWEEIAGLAAGASQPILAAATVNQPGLYVVTVIVDQEDRITGEGDETNNVATESIYLQ